MRQKLSSVRNLDNFKLAQYDLSYKSENGSLSTWLTLEYYDGAAIDFNIANIVGYGMSQEAADVARSECYVGQEARVFPANVNSSTAPRLWEAKQLALMIMDDYNVDFILLSMTAVVFILTIGVGTNFKAGSSSVTRRLSALPRRTFSKTVSEGSGSEALLTNKELGAIVKWGEGATSAGVEATIARTRALTPEAVSEMVKKGLNRRSVNAIVKKYEEALSNQTKAAAGPQLKPRLELMQKILELWPK